MTVRAFAILAILTCTSAMAQPVDRCEKVLGDGIRDHYNIQSVHLFRSYLREILNYSHDELRTFVEQQDGSISVPIPLAEAVLSAEASSSSFKDLLEQFRIEYSRDLTLELTNQDFESFHSSVINKDVLDAWLECIRITTAGEGKLRYEVVGREGEIYAITFRYVPAEQDDPEYVEVQALNVLGGSERHVPTRIKDGVKLHQYTAYTQFFRRSDQAAESTITLDLVGRPGVSVVIPALKRTDVLPVGTVVASILPWPVYAATVHDPSAYSPIENAWAPCDSRSIRGSELARLGGGPTAPDLRGVFLRGLNSFATDEPSAVPSRQRDHKARTKAGEFQGYSPGSHRHKFKGNGAGGVTSADAGGDRNGLWHDGDWGQSGDRHTHANPGGETRPVNITVYYYVKIN